MMIEERIDSPFTVPRPSFLQRSLDLLDATTLALIAEIPRTKDPRLNWTLDDSTGEDIEMAREELWLRDPFLRFGHTSLVAARILLQSRAVCAGCDTNIGLRGLAARDRAGALHRRPQRPGSGMIDQRRRAR